jgi:hypothetical protein
VASGLSPRFQREKQERRRNDCQANIEHQTDSKVQIGNPRDKGSDIKPVSAGIKRKNIVTKPLSAPLTLSAT